MARAQSSKSALPIALTRLAQRVVQENAAAGRTIATAESCTGGLVSAAITEIPGSSAVFEYGFVTYANAAKIEILGVRNDMIEAFGAVSAATAWAMALGALEKSGADVAVAVSGVAGPDGGSAEKPVGTVVFALAQKGQNPEEVFAEVQHYDADLPRGEIRMVAALHALQLLLPRAISSEVETPNGSEIEENRETKPSFRFNQKLGLIIRKAHPRGQ